MTPPRILGVVMARDEWPMVALAITHALSGHVEHVAVLDHASTDASRTGLERLQQEWPGRITVFWLDDPGFLQEAATNLIVRLGRAWEYDWVYVFDADEFVLTPAGLALPAVLADVAVDVDVVRYEVHNWVAPTSFDESQLRAYREIRQRAVPNVFVDVPGELLADEIEHGSMNFFDVPFASKVIVRGRATAWIGAGAHGVRLARDVHETVLMPSRLRAGHLPLVSRARLHRKARQGQALIDAGFSPRHGWQSRMFRNLELSGRLDGFWAAHSIAEPLGEVPGATPTTERDDALAEALERSLRGLDDAVHASLPAERTDCDRGHVPLGAAVAAVHVLQVSCDAVAAERHAEMAVLAAERDAAVAVSEVLTSERDAAAAASDARSVERDDALAQLHAIQTSRIWRSSAGYRRWRSR